MSSLQNTEGGRSCVNSYEEILPLVVVVVVVVAGWQRGECVVNLSRGSRADFALIILIVKLCGPVSPQPWVFTPQVEEVFPREILCHLCMLFVLFRCLLVG